MIVLHSKYRFKSERRERALELVDKMVAESRQEDGVVDYVAALDHDNHAVVHFFDQYEDSAALAEHAKQGHVQQFSGELPELLAAEPEITQFHVETRSELDPEIELAE